MWVLQVDDRQEIAIHGTWNEWVQVQGSMAQAKECGWATFLAQKAQEEHERRHAQIAEQMAPDHFLRELRDPEYWRNLAYQASNNNRLLTEIVRLVGRVKDNDIDIIECAIQIGYYERMYYAQAGMFSIPPVTHKTLIRLHSKAFGIPRINDNVYTCIPTPGQLLTNKWGDALDWVLMPEGVLGAKRIITPWAMDCEEYPASPEYYQSQGEDRDERA